MKEFEFLALEAHEFLDMVDVIARERMTLKTKKRTDDSISLMCRFGLRLSKIHFKTVEENGKLRVLRKVNWFPLVYSTIPILLLLETIMFLIFYFSDKSGIYSYFLVAAVWIVALTFMIYQTFVELEEIFKKLYRVEV
ncbi:MAG: hypothetical protein KAS63_04085 [Candidatus Heimdallarchaeota archaeon]|nr:hypothetical protein [Candidatus Heimdallarchaeota archaeon]MCK4954514.1 hypothetical protein [Candidatus Heimdallarchaeota archaeon]